MPVRFARFVAFAVLALVPVALAQAPEQPRYLTPPPEIVAAFNVEPLPATLLSPNRQQLALTYRKGQPPIAELAQPVLRLAGARVNPKNFGPQRTGLIYAIGLKPVAGGSEMKVAVPPHARISHVKFSPDGSNLSFLNTREIGNRAVGRRCRDRRRQTVVSGDATDQRRRPAIRATGSKTTSRSCASSCRRDAARRPPSRLMPSGRTCRRTTARPRLRRPTKT